MRAELLIQTLQELWKIKRNTCVIGPPGGGKTTIVEHVAGLLETNFIHKHMPTMLVEDFGVPDMLTDRPTFGYKLPDWLPTDPEWEGIVCFDDRGQCGPDLQKVIANMIQAREHHGQAIPEGAMFISTSNRKGDKAGVNRTLTHLADRETELELETMLDDWTRWAIDHNVSPSVISFLRFRPNLLHDFDPQRDNNPSPRSWVEGVSDEIDVVSPEAEYDVFKGAVGEGAAAEYVGFRKIEKGLPNIDNLLLHPDRGDVPTDPATLYALAGGIANRASNSNFSRVITYCDRMPPEFSVLAISYATRKDPELASTQAFTTWAVNNQDVLF